jgi:hypothetical protein
LASEDALRLLVTLAPTVKAASLLVAVKVDWTPSTAADFC